jgi:hypothetical protein
VTITGTNFNSVTKITFCGDTQGVYTVVSSTSITTFAPNRTPTASGETCDIQVTTATGTTALSSADQFSYLSSTGQGPSNGAGIYTNASLTWYATLAVVSVIAAAAFALLARGRVKRN